MPSLVVRPARPEDGDALRAAAADEADGGSGATGGGGGGSGAAGGGGEGSGAAGGGGGGLGKAGLLAAQMLDGEQQEEGTEVTKRSFCAIYI